MSRLATLVCVSFVSVGVLVGQTRAEEAHKAWWDFLKGDWTWQISPLGTEGTVTWSLAAKGNVLVGRFKGSDGASSIEVSGYRSDTQTLAVYGFGSQGNCWQLDLSGRRYGQVQTVIFLDAKQELHWHDVPRRD